MNMKVYLYNDNSEKLTAHHRPFTFDCEITTDVDESDRILLKPSDYTHFLNDISMKPYHSTGVVYANDDNPNYLLGDSKVRKLIAQPLQQHLVVQQQQLVQVVQLLQVQQLVHLHINLIMSLLQEHLRL